MVSLNTIAGSIYTNQIGISSDMALNTKITNALPPSIDPEIANADILYPVGYRSTIEPYTPAKLPTKIYPTTPLAPKKVTTSTGYILVDAYTNEEIPNSFVPNDAFTKSLASQGKQVVNGQVVPIDSGNIFKTTAGIVAGAVGVAAIGAVAPMIALQTNAGQNIAGTALSIAGTVTGQPELKIAGAGLKIAGSDKMPTYNELDAILGGILPGGTEPNATVTAILGGLAGAGIVGGATALLGSTGKKKIRHYDYTNLKALKRSTKRIDGFRKVATKALHHTGYKIAKRD